MESELTYQWTQLSLEQPPIGDRNGGLSPGLHSSGPSTWWQTIAALEADLAELQARGPPATGVKGCLYWDAGTALGMIG
ncbi:hypothetical protein ACFWSF_25510 [Streptomyces sp. NPDC058611]|uniref:hypothetical protein n=1 Tax=unclassified Streptomyces TaxID=2593676 RepID=UPI00364A019A